MGFDSFIFIIGIILTTTLCLTWIVYFVCRVLVTNTDIGKQKKKENKKKQRIQNSQDDVPVKDIDLNLFKKPKIETSFGGGRIGEVHEYEKKNE